MWDSGHVPTGIELRRAPLTALTLEVPLFPEDMLSGPLLRKRLLVSFNSHGHYPIIGEPRVDGLEQPVVCFACGVDAFLDKSFAS
jgi:hypothetical protein